jgi:hypothetical protein
MSANYRVGDEWTDGEYNYIVVHIEDRLTADDDAVVRFVTVFDGEGISDTMPESVWAESAEGDRLKRVDEPLAERLAEWRAHRPEFPLL